MQEVFLIEKAWNPELLAHAELFVELGSLDLPDQFLDVADSFAEVSQIREQVVIARVRVLNPVLRSPFGLQAFEGVLTCLVVVLLAFQSGEGVVQVLAYDAEEDIVPLYLFKQQCYDWLTSCDDQVSFVVFW